MILTKLKDRFLSPMPELTTLPTVTELQKQLAEVETKKVLKFELKILERVRSQTEAGKSFLFMYSPDQLYLSDSFLNELTAKGYTMYTSSSKYYIAWGKEGIKDIKEMEEAGISYGYYTDLVCYK